jgi:serine/threonine protein kinase
MPDSYATDPRVGTTLKGKWTLSRLLGTGGMASVYAASHRNGAVAAIKILHANFARMPEVRTRFLREGYIANQAGSGAVNVFDDDVDDDGSPYLVMELLQGEPVDARARRMRGRLPLSEVLWIASETLRALEVAHTCGIIHRDLKPENLFWVTPSRIKVLDFGIARLRDATSTDERTRDGLVMGTPGYMAPEQALGVADADARTDVWAMGAIMFRLLTGREVHDTSGQNPLVVVATAKARPVASVEPTVPKEVAEVVDRALEFRREDRYQTAREMLDRVDALMGGAPALPLPSEPAAALASIPPPSEAFEPDPQSTGFASGMSAVDTFALSEALTHIADVARSRREVGYAHATTARRFEQAFAETTRALASAHIGLFWNVVPAGFVVRKVRLCDAAPLPETAAAMHAGGVRMLGLLPGITREEFAWIVRVIDGDASPFDDFATLLQSAQLEHLVYRLDAEKPDMPERVRTSLAPPSLSDVDVPSILGALPGSDAAIRAVLLARLERRGVGHEARIGAALAAADVELAMGLVRVLQTIGSAAARTAMEPATTSKLPIVRLDALSRLGDGTRFRTELRATLDAAGAKQRRDALVGIAKYRIKAAVPELAVRVKAPSFVALAEDERALTLGALETLVPSQAEALAIELISAAASGSPEAQESTRRLAAGLLGRVGATAEARAALAEAVERRRPTSEALRSAAALALGAFDARATARGA